ncbi:SprT-like domain-containing protein [Spiroplasma tabanidicola]|uniref:SprT-like domain-containing protein n=1 Tax=Spiroplasma tabanidicola TaxID=324079 RepID=A0A6I6CAJ3_9MOLU|nr:SprT-like domain-containing protein [Spiroplasma tabanidicola]QGS51951.1 hypothetical protein STABA_v1c05880 [Spiroplasma tabanidicola]
MNEIKIDDIILELTSLHRQLNHLLFNNELKELKINVADNIRSKNKLTKGHFEPRSKWEDEDMQIIIWTLSLNGDPFYVIEVLIHEMVHQWNYQNNIKDVENNGRHNKKFRDVAIKVGLSIPKTIRGEGINDHGKGFNRTSISKDLMKILEKELDFNREVMQFKHQYALDYEPKSYNKRFSYYCACDYYKNVKFTISKKLNILCKDCNVTFKIEQ